MEILLTLFQFVEHSVYGMAQAGKLIPAVDLHTVGNRFAPSDTADFIAEAADAGEYKHLQKRNDHQGRQYGAA